MGFQVRGLTDEETTALDGLAYEARKSRQQYVLDLLVDHIHAYDDTGSDICLGYLRLDREGDIGEGARCPECNAEYGNGNAVWVAVGEDLKLYGPYCGVCSVEHE